MNMAGRQGWNLRGPCKPPTPRGENNPAWKGDGARTETKRNRARRLYPMGPCEKCSKPGRDRHHRDGDTGNNVPSNVAILCRRCHMAEDGRLDVFKSTSVSLRGPQPPKPCVNCKRLCGSKGRLHGRCHACSEYLRRRGVERPYVNDGRTEKLHHLRHDAKDNARRRRENRSAAVGQGSLPGLGGAR